ncbi:MAG: hypothetical protein M1817_002752 [Caeruleum heppii]|nr:MAG: hypothetical protein M1817_002752 [Caeruleum heppii]
MSCPKIYPSDANLITSVLDIHPPLPPPYSPTSAAPEATEDPVSSTPIRVLEAGTGHGSLTLYLARAVAACNTAPPFVPPLHWDLPPHKPNSSTTSEIPVASEEAQRQRFSDWLDTRTAHLHTIEVNSAVSALARRNIHAFHRGTYYPHITFHTSPLDAFLASSLSAHSQNAFLTHAVLDLPDSHLHLEQLSKALHPDAVLVVFTPSISQVMKAVEVVRRTKVGLVLDSVMELSSGKGGREWDVRATQTRAKQRAKMERQRTAAGTLPESTASKAERDTSDAEEAAVSSSEQPDSPAREEDDYEMVCRPKVGMRVVGGGFLSVWRRTRDDDDQAPSEMPLNE